MAISLSEGKTARLKNARMRYEEWCRNREMREYEVNRACTELIERVMTVNQVRNLKRECLYELEEVVRKKIDRKNLASDGHHLVGKRKRIGLRKYKLRTIHAETETENVKTEKSVVIETEKVVEKVIESERVKNKESVSNMLDMREILPRHRKVVSPGILKMSRLFEKSEIEPECEKVEKQESNVTRIKNSLELMMSNTKVRKSKYEVKRNRKQSVPTTENEAPQRKIMESWVRREKLNGSRLETTNMSERKVPVRKKLSSESEKNENDEKDKVTSFSKSRISQIVVKNIKRQEQSSLKQEKVLVSFPKSRHRRGSANEKGFTLKNEDIGQKIQKSVQKAKVLEEKVKVWDNFFLHRTDSAKKNRGPVIKKMRPILNEKLKKNTAEYEPNQTENKKQELSRSLRGTNSVGVKRAEKLNTADKHIFVQCSPEKVIKGGNLFKAKK